MINNYFELNKIVIQTDNCSKSYQNLEEPTTITIIKELNDLTTSFVQAYRANIQPRVYDLTEDVVFLFLLIAIY